MFPSRHDTQQYAMNRMTSLVRQIGEQQEQAEHQQQQQLQQQNQSSSTTTAREWNENVDLSFYQLKVDYDIATEGVNNVIDAVSSQASQIQHLNLQHNYLMGNHVFLNDKYDEAILTKLEQLKSLNLAHNEYKSFNLDLLSSSKNTLEYLNVSFNNLESFSVDSSENVIFDKLSVLLLNNNRHLSSLNLLFANLFPNIVELDLSYNELSISSIQPLLVGATSLPQLKILRLNNNKLSGDDFPAATGDYIALSSLEELYLDENEISGLSDQWIQNGRFNQSLKVLSLAYNQVKKLNNELFNETIYPKLTILNANNNKIEALPAVVKSEDSQMKELRLNHNKLTEIQSGQLFSHWGQLIHISLQGNKLQQLPEDISNLKNIEELYVFDNELTSLPSSIGELTQLKELDVYDNNLQTIPEEIGKLTNLKRLNLEDNDLRTLPNTIINLTQLLNFTLRGNPQLQISPFVMMMRTDK
jgi:leucine-rich repeat protein SHOC2